MKGHMHATAVLAIPQHPRFPRFKLLNHQFLQPKTTNFAQASEASALKGQDVPLHAGLWGLARCLRLEAGVN
jgi:hypothetical protein